jgi:hypothetical protein
MRMRVAGVALLSAALSGCWVMDELDAGSKKMDRFTSKGAAPAEAEPAEELPAPAAGGKPQRIGEYFASQKNTRTLTKGQLPGDIVSCKLDGATQFMKQSECLSRGGVPKG